MIEEKIERPWLLNYDSSVPPTLNYDRIPLYGFLDRAAEEFPKRTAVVFNNYKISYAQLKELSERVAANFQKAGLRRGDRVAIMLPNLPQTIITYWAVLKAGGTIVMTNPLYMETELVHHFTDAKAKFLITLDMLWPKISSLLPRFSLDKVIVTSIADGLKFPLNFLYRVKSKREGKAVTVPFDETVVPWKTLLQKNSAPLRIHPPDPERDIALLQYTGGTTGISKGVMLSHTNMTANVFQILSILHKIGRGTETFLGLLPYFHIYGLTVCLNLPTALAATLAPFPRFVPGDVLKATKKIRPTVFPGAPAIYISLLQQKNIEQWDLSSIRYCVSGSAPIPVETIERFKRMTGAEIIEGYGLTEASPVTHLNPLDGQKIPGSIGMPFPDTDAAIVDMEVGSIPMPPGKIGELVIRGPQVMKGYWKRPDETASVLRNGWLYTGDVAYMDEKGYFYIVDRKKDMILSAGYNVYPREIDEVLHEHPKVKEAVAVGIPHPTRGEIIKAYVVPMPGEKLTRSEIIGFCRQKLANYKVPKDVEFRTELPRTMVGKVLRRALRKEEEEKGKELKAQS
ncbi:MAG: long-chain-fatty-acid--CoA ligase [Desulfovibrionales bacterium]